MTECKDCLCYLPVCKAECCRSFNLVIKQQGGLVLKKGKVYAKLELTSDLRHYYKLHGCETRPDGIITDLKKWDWNDETNTLTVYNRCMALSKDNKCKLHGLDSQPQICHSPNNKGDPIPGATVTPNCLYRGLYVQENKEEME